MARRPHVSGIGSGFQLHSRSCTSTNFSIYEILALADSFLLTVSSRAMPVFSISRATATPNPRKSANRKSFVLPSCGSHL